METTFGIDPTIGRLSLPAALHRLMVLAPEAFLVMLVHMGGGPGLICVDRP